MRSARCPPSVPCPIRGNFIVYQALRDSESLPMSMDITRECKMGLENITKIGLLPRAHYYCNFHTIDAC